MRRGRRRNKPNKPVVLDSYFVTGTVLGTLMISSDTLDRVDKYREVGVTFPF